MMICRHGNGCLCKTFCLCVSSTIGALWGKKSLVYLRTRDIYFMSISKFSKEQVELACVNASEYKDVAQKLGCSISYAGNLVRSYNISFDVIHGAKPKYTKEQLEQLCENYSTYKEIADKLNCRRDYIIRIIKSFNIKFDNKQKLGVPIVYTKAIVEAACKDAKSYDDVRHRLGIKDNASSVYTLLKKYGLSVPFKKFGRPDIKGTLKKRKEIKKITDKKYEELLNKTSFLNVQYTCIPYQQRTWHVINNDLTIQNCICGKLMIFKEKRYKYCSQKCTNIVVNSKSKKTSLEKYGVIHHSKLETSRLKSSKNAQRLMTKGLYGGSSCYKSYTLPSGRIIKIQGYENRALDELLKIYNEDNILYGPKEIHAHLGLIKYVNNNREYKYYPDLYIKSEHKIIEVKSSWTYDQKGKNKILRKINETKRDACIKLGLNFEFKIY